MMDFRDRIEQLLAENNMSAVELSKRTGISESAISCYRKGTRTPTGFNLVRIAYGFGISVSTLLEGVFYP